MSADEQKILSKEQIDLVIGLYSQGNYHDAIIQIKELNKKHETGYKDSFSFKRDKYPGTIWIRNRW